MSILQESENEFSNVSKTDSELDWLAHEESQQIGHSYIAYVIVVFFWVFTFSGYLGHNYFFIL